MNTKLVLDYMWDQLISLSENYRYRIAQKLIEGRRLDSSEYFDFSNAWHTAYDIVFGED